jgi:bifunctional non-homologous end joining protein LigD
LRDRAAVVERDTLDLVDGMKRPSGFIEPCLPSLADRPPSGSDWIHEIKHDGFRLLACRGPAGVRLLTRNATDFTARYPLIVEALAALPVQSCVIDGEAVACDGAGLSIFEKLRWRHHDRHVFLWAFDLIELNGQDLRREPIEVRKATLASVLRLCRAGIQFNQHLEHPGAWEARRSALSGPDPPGDIGATGGRRRDRGPSAGRPGPLSG